MAIGSRSTGRCWKSRSSRAAIALAARLVNPSVLDLRSRCVLRGGFCVGWLFQASDFVAVEIHGHAPRVDVARAPLLEIVDIVPTFLVEAVGHHGRAQQVSDLAACHAFLYGVDGALIEEIALLNVDSVHAVGSHQSYRGSQNQALNYFHVKW